MKGDVKRNSSPWTRQPGFAARKGKRAEALEMIRKLQERAQKDKIGIYEVALVYAGLGEKDQVSPGRTDRPPLLPGSTRV